MAKAITDMEDSLSTSPLIGMTTIRSNIGADFLQIIDTTLVSHEAMKHVLTVNSFVICGILSIFGIVSNIVNIVVFVKMKFKETINIALLGLSISDLGASVTLLCSSLLFSPWLLNSGLPIQILDLQKPSSYSHVIFMRVAALITVYITLERCLCIAFPLKVKQILTLKRVKFIIFMIFFLTVGLMMVGHATGRLGWKFDSYRNKTVLGLVFNEHRQAVAIYIFFFNSISLLFSFASVIVISSIIIWKLIQRGKWRDQMTTGSEKGTSSRDSQVIKMVVCVALVFIFSLTPAVIMFLAGAFVPDINLGKRYQNLFFTFSSIMGDFDAINSGANIFIYYKMSSKYRQVFRSMFCRVSQ